MENKENREEKITEKEELEEKEHREESPVERLKKELEEKNAEVERLKELYLRKCADLENYKKRVEKEKSLLVEFANEELIKELLPVMDDLERAIEHIKAGEKDEKALESMLNGVELTLKKFFDVLKKFGLESIPAEGEKFDPSKHEAISHEETEEFESGTVIKELQKGYLLKKRLLRPTLVVVAKETDKDKDQQ